MPVGTSWTPEEDQRLAQLVQVHGPKKWSLISSQLLTKGSKQCRRRWKNFIALEERKQGSWTPEEDAQLLDGHRRHGNKWTLIAQEIGGRTDNAVKNRFAALEKKRKGIDDPFERSVAPRLNDLGVQRVMHRDQPHHTIGEGRWLEPPQLQYAYSPGLATQQTDVTLDGAAGRKPDLMINIPSATVTEMPYSQQPQGHVQARCDHRDAGSMDVAGQLRSDDDGSMLSSSRQTAPGALAALASPGDSLYRFLCNATPHEVQQSMEAGGRQSPPPWLARPEPHELQHQPQQEQLQPGSVRFADMQQEVMPSAPAELQQQQQQQQGPLYQQQVSITTAQLQPSDVQLQQQGRAMHLTQQQGMHPAAALPSQLYHIQQAYPQQVFHGHRQQFSRGKPAAADHYQPPFAAPYTAPTAMAAAASQPGPGRYMQTGASLQQLPPMQQRYPQQSHLQQPIVWQVGAPRGPAAGLAAQYMPGHTGSLAVNGMPAAAVAPQLVVHQDQQQQEHKHWGREELRQLLDILGEQQQQQHQHEGHAACVVTTTALQSKVDSPAAVPVEEEMRPANNANGVHLMHQPQVLGLLGPVQQGTAFQMTLTS